MSATEDHYKKLEEILDKHEAVFTCELGRLKDVKVCLPLKEEVVLKFCKPRKVPLAFKEEVEDELDRLERTGIITAASTADVEWGNAIINPHLKDDHHPLPIIDEIFAALQGGKHFSKLGLKNAYYQLEVDEETKRLLAWSTHRGVFLMNRLPFGTKPACSVFQATLERVLQGCSGTVNYLDDVMVTGRTMEEHLQNLEHVLQRLEEAGLLLNKEKREFFKEAVDFLGHRIDKDGLHKDPGKVKAILEVEPPMNTKEVRSFVGLVNYYAKFGPNLAHHLQPLYELLKDGVDFSWNKKRQQAFEKAKKLIAGDTVLAHYYRNIPVKLYCNASNAGIGAVITHVFPDKSERPISFASRVYKKHEGNYSAIDREALAIFYGVNKFYSYLAGRHFTLVTDHKPLVGLFSTKGVPETAARRLQRWAVFLTSFDYEIQHVKGVDNTPADFLSRFPLAGAEDEAGDDSDFAENGAACFLNFLEMETRSPVERKQLVVESRRDKVVSHVVEYLKSGWPTNIPDEEIKKYYSKREELSVEEGVLLWGYRIIVPTKLRKSILMELHSAHLGIVKMKCLARSYFWWPSMDKEIEDIGKRCEMCMQLRPERNDPISPWKLTNFPGDRVHTDHFQFRGAEFLVIVDSYTFSSDEFEKYCLDRGIRHLRTTRYSPCSNGAAENAVKTVKAALTKLSSDPTSKGKSTAVLLWSFLEKYRATKHATTNESPFKLMFGREMRLRFDALKKNPSKQQHEDNSNRSQTKAVTFEVGEIVYARDYRDPKKPAWVRATVVKKLGAVLYECDAVGLKRIKRRSHQLLKYPYDDFQDEHYHAAINNDVDESCDNSVYGEDFVDQDEEFEVPRIGHHQPDGTYVTRSNRATRHGKCTEKVAQNQLRGMLEKSHKNSSLYDSGLIVDVNHPELAASPDGILKFLEFGHHYGHHLHHDEYHHPYHHHHHPHHYEHHYPHHYEHHYPHHHYPHHYHHHHPHHESYLHFPNHHEHAEGEIEVHDVHHHYSVH
ncbi:uncharacterized protein K02A2.6-like [Aedes albopictus]|uniref:RNA-directed DNA polymerase n=1 Tax=Aedes albopictus TaxID=7160 RepID=A0ABM1XMD4_AEDAL